MRPKSYTVSLVLIFSIGILVNLQNFNLPMAYAQNINLVKVPATAGDSSDLSSWVDSGISLSGNTISVKSSGKGYYCAGGPEYCPSTPDGPPPDTRDEGRPPDLCPACNHASAPVGALVAKVGDGSPVFIGSGPTSISGNGKIYFSFNDGYGHHSDNSGEYLLSVTGAPGPFSGEVDLPTKIAITFIRAHVYESHAATGCSEWKIWAEIRDQNGRPTQPAQTVVDKCVDQDNTYVLDFRPSIVDEGFGSRNLNIWGCSIDWGGSCSSLGTIFLDIGESKRYYEKSTNVGHIFNREIEYADYALQFDVVVCPHPYNTYSTNLCADPGWAGGYYPAGIYYTMQPWADPETKRWISGVAPNTDLHGHSCIFTC